MIVINMIKNHLCPDGWLSQFSLKNEDKLKGV